MYKSKILVGLVVLVYLLTILFQVNGNDVFADATKSFILPVFTLIYFLYVKNKTLFFTLFLVLYSVSDLLMFLTPYIPSSVDYYLGNSLYILSYFCLLIEVTKSVNVLYVLRHYKIHVLVLTILNIYIIYVLQVIIDPHMSKTNEFYVELVYNIVMLCVLSVSLVNYFYKDNVKSLYLFLGALCIVFGEVIWVAYAYISERNLLNALYLTLFILAFYFFIKQSEILYEESDEVNLLVHQ